MEKTAVFPGSFDPITKGHENIIKRAIPLFDKIIIALGENADKKNHFSIEERVKWLEKVFEHFPSVSVKKYRGLTVEFCKNEGANYILRGLRTSADFEFERSIGQINKQLGSHIETVFMLALPVYTPVNSSVVRDIHRNGGSILHFIPEAIHEYFK